MKFSWMTLDSGNDAAMSRDETATAPGKHLPTSRRLSPVVQESPNAVGEDGHDSFNGECPSDTSSDIAEFHDCGRRKRLVANPDSRLVHLRQPQRGGESVHQKRGGKDGI
jgi:hypothetical protein